jgi:hypothetical protein
MKTKILSVLLLVTILISCSNNFLEEKTFGIIRANEGISSESDLEHFVNGLYSSMNLMYNQSIVYVMCLAGDDVTCGWYKDCVGFDIFNVHNEGYEEYKLKILWEAAYNSIKQSNVIICNIQRITQSPEKSTISVFQQDRALGQTYFIRALAYYNLVRTYGQVPLIIDLEVDYHITRSTFAEIYQFIIGDLKKAESLVPDDYKVASEATELEKASAYARPTKGTVKALMASVYLTMAGYPLKEASAYALAAQKAKEVIDNESAYGYQLLPNFADLWKWQNGWQSTGNAEDVFACYFNHNVVDWKDNGSFANGNMNAPSAFFPQNLGGWSEAFAELTFFNEFPAGPRKDATFITSGQKSPKDPIITWHDFAFSHPYYKKYTDVPGYDSTNMSAYIDWWSSRTVQVIRYAEVLLVYAEAKAMSGGPDALAYQCLNRVRNRAGLENVPAGLSNTTFRDMVIDERKWEFAGMEPNARWYDMVRTETVESATAKRDPAEEPLRNQPNKDRYFAPIPSRELELNPNL